MRKSGGMGAQGYPPGSTQFELRLLTIDQQGIGFLTPGFLSFWLGWILVFTTSARFLGKTRRFARLCSLFIPLL
jgi:hypothetical protein